MIADTSPVADNAIGKGGGEMPGVTISSIDPGDVNAEAADRAARRLRIYLETHPDEDLVEALGETGDVDALVIPRPTAIMLAQVLDALGHGQGVVIFPKEVEFTTQQ